MEFENLIRLIETVSASSLTDFKYEKDGERIRLSKKNTAARQSVLEIAAAGEMSGSLKGQEESGGQIVKSPLVGTYYSSPGEGADAFVSLGDHVTKGQTLAIVEAMKLMNEIESEYDGTVSEIYVENGQPVEYDQPLFKISQEGQTER